jgi:hypothetical protein
VNIEELYVQTLVSQASHNCKFYYCSTCGGQSNRVQIVIERLGADHIFQELLKIDIADYLKINTDENKRQFLKHLVEGADWGSPILNLESVVEVRALWQSQVQGDEYRKPDEIFQFTDYDAYEGRDDHFDIDVVMSEHQGQCFNRQGLTVQILSTDAPGEFSIMGRINDGTPKGETDNYRWDGSHYDYYSYLIMPEDYDKIWE